MSVPYHGQEFIFTQPDGSQLPVKAWRNQGDVVFETADGFTVVRDPVTGFWQYAALNKDGDDLVPTGSQAGTVNPSNLGLTRGLRSKKSRQRGSRAMSSELSGKKPRWQERREQQQATARGTRAPKRQTVGDFVGLCLLIDFPDVPGTISREEVEAFCNQRGYNVAGNNGSVFDYFFDVSGGKLRYTNLVAPYYTAKNNQSHYSDQSRPNTVGARELIKEALDSLVSQGFDFSPLTVDNQGYVYATNVFYPGGIVNDPPMGLWPHASRTDDYELMPGKKVADYQISNMGTELTIGTFCHENGHMICQFPDLYDYGNDSYGVSSFCLMGRGGNIAKNPTQVGAYLKYRAGWANSVTDITPGLNATVRAGVNDFFIRKKNEKEYYIIENRHKSGRDEALPGSGLAIWHVDELGNSNNQQMTPELHYECSLVQADGLFDLERQKTGGEAKDLFHGGGNTHFGDTTNPNSRWWDGSPSGLDISDISDSGEEMTFVVNG